jgi:hypothetical protein
MASIDAYADRRRGGRALCCDGLRRAHFVHGEIIMSLLISCGLAVSTVILLCIAAFFFGMAHGIEWAMRSILGMDQKYD